MEVTYRGSESSFIRWIPKLTLRPPVATYELIWTNDSLSRLIYLSISIFSWKECFLHQPLRGNNRK